MGTAFISKNNSSALEWDKISISPSIAANMIATPNNIYFTLDNTVNWTKEFDAQNPFLWIENTTSSDIYYPIENSTNIYRIEVPPAADQCFLKIHFTNTFHVDSKIKKLFEKITDKFLYFEKIGMAAEIHGKNSAGTGDCSLATTFKNPLAGQCQGVLYGVNGTATTASTSTQQNSAFVVTPSTGKIKVLEKGHYLVIASAYAYTGFTANDSFDFYVQVGDSRTARLRAVEKMSGTYQIIYLIQTVGLAANSELSIAVANATAARGIVTSGLPTTLQVMRLN